MSKQHLFHVVDFNAGLGGRTSIVTKLGHPVVAAIEDNQSQREIFQILHPQPPLLYSNQVREIPSADIVMASLSSQSFRRSFRQKHLDEEISSLMDLMCHTNPIAFLFQVPVISIKHAHDILFSSPLVEQYKISYKTFSATDYSGYSINCKQLYFVGVHRDCSAPFLFPKPDFSQTKTFFMQDPNLVDLWYRKLPPTLHIPAESEYEKFFYRTYTGLLRVSDNVPSSRASECYLMDSIGPRHLTHEEYARLKGYQDFPYNQWPDRHKMYQMLQQAPDMHIADAIIHSLLKTLCDEINLSSTPIRKHSPKSLDKSSYSASSDTTINSPPIRPKNVIISLHIDKLKGLKNLDISFEKGLTAIMGVNGAGKSTILHALACMFSPFEQGEDYKFNFFFTPTPDASWQGSSFELTFFDENTQTQVKRRYTKMTDRWSPRYANRPKRDVFYLGIDTGLPEIEKERQTTFIDYDTDVDADSLSNRVIRTAAEILRKDYQQLTSHKTKRKSFFGVHTKSDITYTSLSMGAGEQRLIKILTTVYRASPYSLILIDELDLLLHSDAQKRLVQKLSELALQKNLQVVFTTHSLEIGRLDSLLSVQYLYHTREKTMVYNRITSDIVFDMSRDSEQPLTVYVEDDLAEIIVSQVASGLRMSRYVKINNIGSIENAFTLAAGLVIENSTLDNQLIVLDGDTYRSAGDKISRIKKVLSGTESNHEEKVEAALSVLTQFSLPEQISPEKFIYDMLIDLDGTDEVTDCAKQITCVVDSHDWLNDIVARMNQDRHVILYQIVDRVSESNQWASYIDSIRSWLIQKQSDLNLTSD